MAKALDIDEENEFKLINKIFALTGVEIPNNLKDLDKKEIRQSQVIEKEDIKKTIMEILGEKK